MPASSSISRSVLVSCKRAAEMIGEVDAVFLRHAENAHAQPADRARHPVAIKIERGEIGRADIAAHVHLHAVDDGQEILAPQAEGAHRLRQARKLCRRRAGIDRIDVAPPLHRAAQGACRGRRPRRRYRRPRGRRRRRRTWPGAARAAECAWRHRTSCPRRSPRLRHWPLPLRAKRREAPCISAHAPRRRPLRACRGARAPTADRARASMRVSVSASRWITDDFQAQPAIRDLPGKTGAFLQQRRRAGRRCR